MSGKFPTISILKIIFILSIFFVVIYFLDFPFNNKNLNKNSEPKSTLTSLLSDNNIDGVKYSGWIPFWRQESALKTIQNTKKGVLSEINPVWYVLDENGKFTKSGEVDDSSFKSLAKTKKIKIVPTVNNVTASGFDSERASLLIKNKDMFIDEIVQIAIDNDYSGWDLDLEEINKADREGYVLFARDLAMKLNAVNLTLSVTVHAQSGINDWGGTKGQDIKRLAEYADFIRVMAYDFHNSTSGSGAITPNDDLTRTIRFTLENVKIEKIVMCLPTYGYDWSKNGVTPLQYEDANKIVVEESVVTKRDSESFELTGEYTKDGVNHVLWYQDATASLEKINIIKKFGITNMCFWHLGGEDSKLLENLN